MRFADKVKTLSPQGHINYPSFPSFQRAIQSFAECRAKKGELLEVTRIQRVANRHSKGVALLELLRAARLFDTTAGRVPVRKAAAATSSARRQPTASCYGWCTVPNTLFGHRDTDFVIKRNLKTFVLHQHYRHLRTCCCSNWRRLSVEYWGFVPLGEYGYLGICEDSFVTNGE